MYTIDWKRISNGGNFVVLEVADINMVKKKKKKVLFILSFLSSAGSSHILGQACASMGSDSDISDSHPCVW